MAEKPVVLTFTAEDKTDLAFRAIQSKMDGLGASFAKLSTVMATFTGGSLALAFSAASKAAEEAEQASKRLDAVLRATGNASGYTSAQLQTLSEKLALATKFDDEGFKNATAAILRFGDVSGKNLERLLTLSADYAAFTKTDLVSAAETLGKAVTSPAQGVERLQRSVGYLTQSQKDNIKAMEEQGDKVAAQAKLLDLLESKIGGTAAAMNTGLTGATKELTNAINELLEVAGKKAEDAYVVQAIKSLASELRGVKQIIEEGSWFKNLLSILAVGAAGGVGKGILAGFQSIANADVRAGSTPFPTASITGDITVNERAQREADIANWKKVEEELAKLNADFRKRQIKAAEEWQKEEERLRGLDVKGWIAHAEQVFDEADKLNLDMAKISEEFWAKEEKLRDEDLKGWIAYADAVFKAADEENIALAKIMEDRTRKDEEVWKGYLSGVEGAFRDAWNHIGDSWSSALDAMKNAFKRILLDFIWQSLAKPFVLSIVATTAGTLGASTLANAAVSAGGSFLGNAAAGAAGTAAAGGSGLMSSAASALAAMGPIGWAALAVAAVAAVAYAFRDKGENWTASLAFGPNATAYTTQGRFGMEGFSQIAGNDATNRAIQAFMASTGKLDTSIAGHLTAEQIARITGNLGGPYTTRNDGQPAQFAFGRGDETAAQQLTLEYLQKKYGTIFDEIDSGFAKFIRDYTGKSEDLLKEIGAFADLLNQLSAMNIKGLDITALRAMQAEGEKLGDTLTRIANQWAWFNDNFYTDAEKLQRAGDLVNTTFASLGIAVPDSLKAFRDLVNGLDLSTEAGRAMWNQLMAVAPAFLQVHNAAEQAAGAINTTTDALDAQRRAQELYWAQVDSVRQDNENRLSAVRGARSGLQGFLGSLLLDTGLTTLDPMQRLNEARTQYEATLQLVRGGDLGAAGQLGGQADIYLKIARELFASTGAYASIFDQVRKDVMGIDKTLEVSQRQLEAILGMSATMADVRDILIQIRDNGTSAAASRAPELVPTR